MRLIVLGSGSGKPTPGKRTSSYLLDFGGCALLLDCGDGAPSALLESGVDPHKISTVAISHFHADHWCSFPLLIQLFHLLGRENPLDVIIPPEGERIFPKILEMSYMWRERIGFDIRWHFWSHAKPKNFCGAQITPRGNTHLRGYRPDLFRHPFARMQCYSLEIVHEGIRGIYSADIGRLTDLDDLLTEPADWLLIEGMHFDLDQFRQWISDKKIGKLIITHIPDSRKGEYFVPGAIIAADGMEIEL